MQFKLPKLPYAMNALAPTMSAETFEFHYGKHHLAYIDKTNQLIPGTEFAEMTLEQMIQKAPAPGPVFNNAAQSWNHTFFWHCLTPNAGAPTGALADAINKKWGSLDAFKKAFQDAGVAQFGSGWAWLVKNTDGSLEIVTTSNALNPWQQGKIPLLTADVWEHAYYVDYRNARAKFLESFWKICNWKFAEACFASNTIANMTKEMV